MLAEGIRAGGGSRTVKRVVGRLGADADRVDALCETKLRQWATVVVFSRAALEAAGVELVPTFRTPHVTLAHADLQELVRRLVSCEHKILVNPYHEPEIGPAEAP